MIGKTVSHYRIIDKLGEGGMGEVFLAEDTRLDRKVALKFLPPHFTRDPEFKARFEHEAKSAAALNHPNIVTVYELALHEGRLFIAMEHVEGQSLEDLIKKGDLTLEQTIDYTRQICAGLGKAHAGGIVHRDIKPSNILIDPDGRARILDFGLATSRKATTKTPSGTTMGTLLYESPEQMAGAQADQRSDLYSVGAVLYELIAGRTPFAGEYEAAIRAAVLNDTPEPLARFKSDVPDALQRVVTRLLEKDPNRRYQTAQDLAADLTRISAPLPTAAPQADWWNRYVVSAAVVILLILAAVWLLPKLGGDTDRGSTSDRKMVAVLPFDNLGAPEDEYFADGITDEIITSLAKLSGLGVISRTSSLQYKGTRKSLQEVGAELGVDYVLEGTIRWDKSGAENRVRINPQLIQTDNDTHLWAERYDAVLTNILDVQATIAASVAEALDLALQSSERQSLAQKQHANPEAYDYYLRGRQHYSVGDVTPGPDDLRHATTMHLQAVKLDPVFAPSYAELGIVHTQMYWRNFDRTDGRLEQARLAIEQARALAPQAAGTHFAYGWYLYHGLLDFERAGEQFRRVLAKEPNNSIALASLSYVERRQGRFDSALSLLRQAVALDPREPFLHYDVGLTLFALHRYDAAEPWFTKAIALAPHYRWAYNLQALSTVLRTGQTHEADSILALALERTGRWPQHTYFQVLFRCLDGRYDEALQLFNGPGSVHWENDVDTAQYYLLKAEVHRFMGNSPPAHACADSARENLEAKVAARPDESLFRIELGLALAGLGQKEAAIREGRRGADLMPVSADAFAGGDRLRRLVEIYILVGEYDLALDQLDYLLSIPSSISIKWLENAPACAPLWDLTRFEALRTKYGGPGGERPDATP